MEQRVGVAQTARVRSEGRDVCSPFPESTWKVPVTSLIPSTQRMGISAMGREKMRSLRNRFVFISYPFCEIDFILI